MVSGGGGYGGGYNQGYNNGYGKYSVHLIERKKEEKKPVGRYLGT